MPEAAGARACIHVMDTEMTKMAAIAAMATVITEPGNLRMNRLLPRSCKTQP